MKVQRYFKGGKSKFKMNQIESLQNKICDELKEQKIYINNNTEGMSDELEFKTKIRDQCRTFFPRDDDYEAKNLNQEVNIIYYISTILPTHHTNRDDTLIIDIGGGNGYLGFFASQILNTSVLVVDYKTPLCNIDSFALTKDPERIKYQRLVKNFKDIDLNHLTIDNYSMKKKFIFVCKHLCGTSLDIVLKKIATSPTNCCQGFVLAPCCYHRGEYSDFVGTDKILKEDFQTIRSSADWKIDKFKKTKAYQIGTTTENIINTLRIQYLKKIFDDDYNNRLSQEQIHKREEFIIEMINYCDSDITPKNQILFGRRIRKFF